MICTEPFVAAACDIAAGAGLGAFPLVRIPHPMAALTPDRVIAVADRTLEQVVGVLSGADHVSTVRPRVTHGPRTQLPERADRAIEALHELEWTDGLPCVPPADDLVAAMLAAVGRTGSEVTPAVPPRMAIAPLERWAANAVMAGCLPAHFPVVLAAMDAVLDPRAGLYSSQTATNASTPLIVVNGPIARALDVASGYDCLGPGTRASASIGRAVRLILRNVGGERPGRSDPATHGQPGKLTYCFAENELETPWEPWHVSRGLAAGDSAVTVVMASAPQNVFAYGCNTADDLLDHLVGALTGLGHNNVLFSSGPLLVLGPEHARLLADAGVTRRQVQRRIFEAARIPLSRFPAPALVGIHSRRARWFATVGDADHIGVADRPEDVHVVVAGGPGIHSQFISTAFSAEPVTRRIAAMAS